MSGSDRPKSGGRKGGLSSEDSALWDIVAGTIQPLKRAKGRVLDVGEAVVPEREARGAAEGSTRDFDTSRSGAPASVKAAGTVSGKAPGKAPGKATGRPHRAPKPQQPAPPLPAPPLADFDRKKAKRLAAGREEISARIDLHGMRQSEAHAALRAFLLKCHAAGRRTVLVITGKGVARDDEDGAERDFAFVRERGVLKRNVPRWLGEPELRTIVISYRPAALQHGGEGALYVHLRAARKKRS